MNEQNTIFIYFDAKNVVSAREIREFIKTKTHLQGVCVAKNAFRTFRLDRILEYVEDKSLIPERLNYHKKHAPQINYEQFNKKKSKLASSWRDDVCFTGFKKAEKENLCTLARDNGIVIRSNVTKELDVLCYGATAGPKKLERARAQGTLILNEEEFKQMLKTGEVPEDR